MSAEIPTLPPSNRKARLLGRLLFFVPAVLLLLLFLDFSQNLELPIARGREAMVFRYQLDGEEGFILNQALRLKSGKGLYPPISEAPYLVDNYPPLFPWLWSLFVDPEAPSLSGGRGMALFFAWLAAFAPMGFLLMHSISGERDEDFTCDINCPFCRCPGLLPAILLGFLCCIFFLSFYSVLRWMAYARVDMPALALSLWGLVFFGLYRRFPRAAMIASACAFVAALFFKQTAIAAPAACLLYLLIVNRRHALWYFIALLLAVLAPVGILCLFTGGRYWLHTITYNRNAMRWTEVWNVWLPHLWRLYHWLLLATLTAVAGATFCRLVFRKKPAFPLAMWLALLYGAFNLLSLTSLAKAGSAENYLLEPLMALVLLTGVSMLFLFPEPRGGNVERLGQYYSGLRGAILVVSILMLFVYGMHYKSRLSIFTSWPRPSTQAMQAGNHVLKVLREHPGDVLCEDPIYTILSDRPVLFQHFIMSQLQAEGRWDDSDMVRRTENREFSLIQAHTDLRSTAGHYNRFTPAMREAISTHYTLLEKPMSRPFQLQPIWLYLPREKAISD
ncbi:MAG: hypothetical protein ACLFUS_07690 [Candidatus Sumerlaeia bacterium]